MAISGFDSTDPRVQLELVRRDLKYAEEKIRQLEATLAQVQALLSKKEAEVNQFRDERNDLKLKWELAKSDLRHSEEKYAKRSNFSKGRAIIASILFFLSAAEARKDTDKIQTHFDSLDSIEEYYSDLARRIKSQYQDSPVKVMMDINGTPITIESNDASKVEDLVKHLAQSMQVSNLAEAKASHFYVREDTGTYKPESNPEQAQ